MYQTNMVIYESSSSTSSNKVASFDTECSSSGKSGKSYDEIRLEASTSFLSYVAPNKWIGMMKSLLIEK